MRVLVTGANGFIGRNVSVQLGARSDITIIPFTRGDGPEQLRAAVAEADFVCHLAGVNRPDDGSEFDRVNAGLTRSLCDLMRGPAALFRSSSHRPFTPPERRLTGRASSPPSGKFSAIRKRPARAFTFSACLTSSESGRSRTTTRSSRPSATTSPGTCRSRSTTLPRG
jgi:Nucleoside-diphosphate-sugar epimerases